MKFVVNFLFKFISCFLVITVLWVLAYKFIPPPLTATMVGNAIKNIGTEQSVFWNYKWVKIDHISAHLQLAVVAAEDQKFPNHFGFDKDAIEDALENNQKGKKIRGGSTISQQTAKNAFLWQGRSWVRKGLEAYFTLLIELIWGKKRILEVYLNIAEMGNGIYGAEAASQLFFNRTALEINSYQAALLAAVLPSPKKYSASKPGPYVRKRQQWVLRQMRNLRGTSLY
jgi:monofunctional biosynthetic peptidoglycan transglycosylase